MQKPFLKVLGYSSILKKMLGDLLPLKMNVCVKRGKRLESCRNEIATVVELL